MIERTVRTAAILFVLLIGGCSTSYFPAGSLDPTSSDLDNFVNDWYSAHLSAMSEPVLVPKPDRRTYRFTWLRSFHRPIAIRVDATSEGATLTAVELDGAGGYDPGKELRRIERKLDPGVLTELEALLEHHKFWSLPAREERLGLDGAEWIVEVATDRYHVVVRWSPEEGPVRAIGDYFISLTKWEIGTDELY